MLVLSKEDYAVFHSGCTVHGYSNAMPVAVNLKEGTSQMHCSNCGCAYDIPTHIVDESEYSYEHPNTYKGEPLYLAFTKHIREGIRIREGYNCETPDNDNRVIVIIQEG